MEWNLIKSKNESPDDSLYMVFRDRRTGEVVGLISEGKGIYKYQATVRWPIPVRNFETYREAYEYVKGKIVVRL